MNEPAQNTSLRIENRIDKGETGSLEIGANGALAFANLNQIMEVAKVVAIAQVAIPKHLRDNVGACLAVCIQASEWQMSPFAVANKTYVVNDRLAYEAQLVNAVILRRAPIVGRFKISYTGEHDKRRCRVEVELKDGGTVDYESPEIVRIPVKNSPLWKGDPDQQLFYYSSRAMCRRHFPDVLLGIYTSDEIEEENNIRNVAPTTTVPKFLKQPAETEVVAEQASPPPETKPQAEGPAETSADQNEADVRTELLRRIEDACGQDSIALPTIRRWAFDNGHSASASLPLPNVSTEGLRQIVENWDKIKGE